MAIGDILEGLLAGAAGGVRGYSAYQQEEAARREREAEREAARLEREEAARRQQAQADRLFALDLLAREARGEIAPTEYVEYAEPSEFLRGEAIGMQRPAAGADMSSILADQPIGMQRQAPSRRSEVASALSAEARDGRMEGGAMVAPGQTYPAIDRVLAEAEPTPRAEDIGARDTGRPARGLDRVLDITPEDIAGRFERAPMQGSWTEGRGTFEGLGGQMYRATTPEERASMARELEQGELERQARNVIAAARLRGLDLTLEQGLAVAEGSLDIEDLISEPTTVDPTALERNLRLIEERFGTDAANKWFMSQMGGGEGGPEPSTVNTLRTTFNREIQEANDIANSYGRVMAAGESALASESPAAQISLVFSYMRMLDPGSVVREGEYATARNAAGVPERVRNTYNAILNGEFLGENQIRDFMNEADNIADVTQRQIAPTIQRARDNAADFGVNPDRVAYDPIQNVRDALKPVSSPEDEDIVSDVYGDGAVGFGGILGRLGTTPQKGTGELLRPPVIR